MLRASFVLLIAIAMFFSAATAQDCPQNQEWNTCGSACPPSCNPRPSQLCTLQCKVGCYCKEGYLLNNARQCVLPNAC